LIDAEGVSHLTFRCYCSIYEECWQAGGCRVPFVYVRPAPGGYTTTITLAHSYKLTYYGGRLPARTLELPVSGPDCPAALQKMVADLLAAEQEVIATTPHVDAGT
jgi:hypothetical protein